MIFPDKYKVNKKYPKKLFLDNKDIEAKDRTFIKKHIISVTLAAQISGEEIPSIDNEDYKYKVIQYLEVELDNIKNSNDMGKIFQNTFKSPLIVKFHDNNGYCTYSYALKRINKSFSNEIVISDSFTTRKKDSFIDVEIRSLYNDFLDISKLLNNSDKVCLYHELYVKAFIIENRQLFNDYMKFLESKVYYDFINMMSFYDALVNLLQCKKELNRASTISKKIEINNRKNSCIDRIYSLI